MKSNEELTVTNQAANSIMYCTKVKTTEKQKKGSTGSVLTNINELRDENKIFNLNQTVYEAQGKIFYTGNFKKADFIAFVSKCIHTFSFCRTGILGSTSKVHGDLKSTENVKKLQQYLVVWRAT